MATNKRTTASNRRSATEPLREKASEVHQSVHELGSAALDAAQHAAAEYRDAAAHQVEDVCDAASEYYSVGRDRAIDFEQSLEERIREKPLQSVMIAVGVGILIGVLWTRR